MLGGTKVLRKGPGKGADRARTTKRSTALLLVIVLAPQTSCISGVDQNDPPPPVTIDFARALALADMAFDLTRNKLISDAELVTRYSAPAVHVRVFSAMLPGDRFASRYMLLTDHARGRQTLVLAGTNTETQWVVDAAMIPSYQADLDANVHLGWHALSFAVYNTVLPSLRSDLPLTVVGYSLGSAVGVIVAEYLTLAGYTIEEVVTFGQPRLTDESGATLFGSLPITRFVSAGDPVAGMKEAGSGAVQLGPMVVLYDGPFYSYVPADDARLEAGARPLLKHRLTDAINHVSSTYRRRLAEKTDLAVQVDYIP